MLFGSPSALVQNHLTSSASFTSNIFLREAREAASGFPHAIDPSEDTALN